MIPLYRDGDLRLYANDFENQSVEVSVETESMTMISGKCKLEGKGTGLLAFIVLVFETQKMAGSSGAKEKMELNKDIE